MAYGTPNKVRRRSGRTGRKDGELAVRWPATGGLLREAIVNGRVLVTMKCDECGGSSMARIT